MTFQHFLYIANKVACFVGWITLICFFGFMTMMFVAVAIRKFNDWCYLKDQEKEFIRKGTGC
jgi:hypothetical protein